MDARYQTREDSLVTGRYTLRQQDILLIALLSGVMGLFLGVATGWQVAVESAQVVAGIVQYPRDNPFAMYHLKTWTLLHQVPAGLLAAGVPERAVAMGIAGLTGVISFLALSFCAYACGAHRMLASFTPVVLLGTQVYGELSSIYPIRVLSDAPWVLYGCFGTSLVLLTWSLMALGARRCAALLMGLSPAVHPTLGAWCLGVGGLAYLWNWHGDRTAWRGPLRCLCFGLLLTGMSLGLHLYLSRDVPDISAVEKASYIAAFAANWDSHRRPFPLDHLVILSAATAVVLCGVWLRFFSARIPESGQFLLRALFLSGVIGIGLCISTQWQEHLPTVLLMAMPGRFVNIAGLAFPALCLGMLDRNRPRLLGSLMLAGFVLYLMLAVQRLELGRLYVPMPGLIFLACAFGLLAEVRCLAQAENAALRPAWLLQALHFVGPFALGALATFVGLRDQKICAFLWLMFAGVVVLRRFATPSHASLVNRALQGLQTVSWLAAAAMMMGIPFTISLAVALTAWTVYERPEQMQTMLDRLGLAQARRPMTAALALGSAVCVLGMLITQAWVSYPTMIDWHNHAVYAGAHRGQGLLLTASTIRATQLRTRRPVLLEGPALNQLPYVPESGPSMNRILKHVYGEDLFASRPADWARGGGLQKSSGRTLWESRELAEWQALAREFGFTQIVTFSTWKLKLPVLARDEKLMLYDIPGLEGDGSTAQHPVDQLPASRARFARATDPEFRGVAP